MRIALCQLNYHIGDFEQNTAKIIAALNKAKADGAELAVFAELAVCGYPPRDFLEFDDFIARCNAAVNEIAKACVGIAAVVGSPVKNTTGTGKSLFNAALLLEEGKIIHTAHKALLPSYDIFDEYRYFEVGREFSVVEWKGKKIALTVCEDLWQVKGSTMYDVTPMEHLSALKPNLIINIAASPFDVNHAEERKEVLSWNAKHYKVPIIYANHTGAQTELIFDGGSMFVSKNGTILNELPYFEEAQETVDAFPKSDEVLVSTIEPIPPIASIHQALVLGIRDYFGKMGFKSALFGLSGGIDSAVVAVLAAEALGKENVKAILMPSEFSSDHSVDDAVQLANNLGIAYEIIPIKNSYEAMLKTLSPVFGDLPFSLAEENIQARTRGVILMGISNKLGGIVLNTSNKSELAVGYGTLYGDMNGGLSVIGDLYKTQVYALADQLNIEREIIPQNTITKAPSAELRPGQKDSDSLPDYDILDKLIFQYVENRLGQKELLALGFDEALVKRVLKMINTNEYKRHQAPPILRVSAKAFGMGRRLPIVGKYLG